jgi:hypothetical protein
LFLYFISLFFVNHFGFVAAVCYSVLCVFNFFSSKLGCISIWELHDVFLLLLFPDCLLISHHMSLHSIKIAIGFFWLPSLQFKFWKSIVWFPLSFWCWLEEKDIDVVKLAMFGSMFHFAQTLLGLSSKLVSMTKNLLLLYNIGCKFVLIASRNRVLIRISRTIWWLADGSELRQWSSELRIGWHLAVNLGLVGSELRIDKCFGWYYFPFFFLPNI